MKRNKGISLIVLVITIIVMIILAGSIILTLNNNGIIDRANEAVKEYNLDEVEQVAGLAWAEAYLDGVRTQQELETAVKNALTANKITEADYEGYELKVTENGVALEKIIAPGLYQTGSDYTVQLKDWDALVNGGIVEINNGKVSKVLDKESELDGDLVVPTNAGITSIDFEDCSSITSIVIPEGLTQIPSRSFAYCYGLSDITIPSSLTEIGSEAFLDCTLETIFYNGSKEQWNAIELYAEPEIYPGEEWNAGCGEITVHCTNGTINILANQG